MSGVEKLLHIASKQHEAQYLTPYKKGHLRRLFWTGHLAGLRPVANSRMLVAESFEFHVIDDYLVQLAASSMGSAAYA